VDITILASRGDQTSIWTEGDRPNGSTVCGKDCDLLAGLYIPESGGSIVARTGGETNSWVDHNVVDTVAVTSILGEATAGMGVPEFEVTVGAARNQTPIVTDKLECIYLI
jgi:hypothetical protein